MANSKRTCAYCKLSFRHECMQIIKTQAFCSIGHAIKYANKVKPKVKKVSRKEFDKETKKLKKDYYDNKHSHQFQLTKKAAQTLANRLDAHLPCICCDAPRGTAQFCGGHFKTAGGHPELALDLRNIHGQRNKTCNMEKSGNISGDKKSKGYIQGIIDRFGQAHLDYLESYHPPKNYTCDDLREIRKEFNKEIRLLESGQPPSKNWRELPNEQI